MAGEEVVQLYIKDHFASAMRPVKELKGFSKIMLQPAETRKVTFTLTWETLAFYAADEVFKAEPGMFTVMVGGNSVDVLTRELELLR
jgi:beta-glucosidase